MTQSHKLNHFAAGSKGVILQGYNDFTPCEIIMRGDFFFSESPLEASALDCTTQSHTQQLQLDHLFQR